jgi:hypothetical protein
MGRDFMRPCSAAMKRGTAKTMDNGKNVGKMDDGKMEMSK